MEYFDQGGDSLKSGLPVTASCNGDGSDRKYALGSQLNLVLDYVADTKEISKYLRFKSAHDKERESVSDKEVG